MRRRNARGKRYTILCVAEGAHAAGGAPVVRELDDTSPDPIKLGGIAAQVAEMLRRRARTKESTHEEYLTWEAETEAALLASPPPKED